MEHSKGHGWRAGLVAAGAAIGLMLAGLGIAGAQTDGVTTQPAQEESSDEPGRARAKRFGHRGGGPGRGLGMGIHGEFTTRNPDGTGFQTMATQRGEVTEVSATSITVKSEDDFSRTYAVNDDTLVNAGNDGIADVAVGDAVHVLAIVEGGNARAVDIHDGTKVRAARGKWAPRPPAAGEAESD